MSFGDGFYAFWAVFVSPWPFFCGFFVAVLVWKVTTDLLGAALKTAWIWLRRSA